MSSEKGNFFAYRLNAVDRSAILNNFNFNEIQIHHLDNCMVIDVLGIRRRFPGTSGSAYRQGGQNKGGNP